MKIKIKINFFQKIFIFSIFIILITVFFNYIFNIFFLDDFYIHRKSKQIVKISDEVKKKIQNNDISLDEYIENIKDKEDINISVFKAPPNDSRMSYMMGRKNNSNSKSPNRFTPNDKPPHMDGMMMHREPFDTIKLYDENVSIVETKRTGIKFLLYEENYLDNYKILISTSLTAIKNYRQVISLFNFFVTLLALCISTIIGRIFSKKITHDIEKLNTTAKKISVLDFSEHLSLNRNDEIGELSDSISIMSKNLESSIENLRSFASNASHELKTPITVINTHAQALVSGILNEENKLKYYKTILRESIEMNDLVTNLLTISRLSSPGIKLKENNISGLKLIKNSIEKYETLELQKDIDWILPNNDIEFLGEEKLLKTAFDNIIQNALKYSKENSKIIIKITDNEITFTNTMASKLSKDKELLWEPFSRGENATDLSIDGNGLGLSIVKMILKLNNLYPKITIDSENFIFSIKK